MRIPLPGTSSLAILVCLLCFSCAKNPGRNQAQPDADRLGAVVPNIDYPDVYAAALGFGFNLPPSWTGQWDREGQVFRFTDGHYLLSLHYDMPDADLHPLLHAIGHPGGQIRMEGFWSGTWLHKHRLEGQAGVILVAYVAQSLLNGRWLTATLEAETESKSQSIPLVIEQDADWILASYEEHGWEE